MVEVGEAVGGRIKESDEQQVGSRDRNIKLTLKLFKKLGGFCLHNFNLGCSLLLK